MRIFYTLLLLLGSLNGFAMTTPEPGRPLAEALNPDGTLRLGQAGSFDARGY